MSRRRRSIVDDNYAWEVWETGGKYPYQKAASDVQTVRISGDEVWLGTRKIRLRRRTPSKKRQMRPVGLKARKKEERPGQWASELNGTSICSYLPPVPGKHPAFSRDDEYKRLGTCSILAALDLHDGHIAAREEKRHRSVEFTGPLADLDDWYPADCTIRIILDNHSADLSKGPDSKPRLVTQHRRNAFRQDGPYFSAAHKSSVLEELKARILKGIAEINAAPVVHRWKAFDLLTPK